MEDGMRKVASSLVGTLMSTGTAARVLGLSAERVRQLERTGRLPAAHTTLTGQRLFDAADVEQLRQARAQAQTARTKDA